MNFILDKAAPCEIKNNLSKFGNVIASAQTNIEDISVSTHPDMQIHFVNDSTAFCSPSLFEYYTERMPQYITLNKGDLEIGRTYPLNCAYNIARIGRFVICNTKYADKKILRYYSENNYTIINVKQGYSKCNICPITDNKFITEDAGIYKTVKETDEIIPIYKKVGDVCLNGFDYGFIGGATGQFDNNILFTGKPSPDLIQIIEDNNKNVISLSNDKMLDLGSIISFT